MKEITNVFLIAGMIFSCIAGAGFVSGKEVWYYFAQFGKLGYVFVILAGILFFIISYLCLKFGKQNSIKSVYQYNNLLYKNKFLPEIIFAFCNIILLSSMFAGVDSLFNITTHYSYRWGSVITAIVVILVVWCGFDKMVKCNFLLVPAFIFIMFYILFMGKYNNLNIEISYEFNYSVFWGLMNSISFVASNIYFSSFVFAKLGASKNDKTCFFGCVLGTILVVVSLICMIYIIQNNIYINNSDMPIVTISYQIDNFLGVFSKLIVWFGIFTTTVSILYTLCSWLRHYLSNYYIISLIIVIVSLLIANLGFANIINIFYPILGLFGVLFIIKMCIVLKEDKVHSIKNKGGNSL